MSRLFCVIFTVICSSYIIGTSLTVNIKDGDSLFEVLNRGQVRNQINTLGALQDVVNNLNKEWILVKEVDANGAEKFIIKPRPGYNLRSGYNLGQIRDPSTNQAVRGLAKDVQVTDIVYDQEQARINIACNKPDTEKLGAEEPDTESSWCYIPLEQGPILTFP